MSNLEDMIRAAATAGQLTHLSVVPVAGKGPNGLSWSASFSPGSVFGTGFGVAADPVDAIKAAMTDKRLGNLVKKIEKTIASATPEQLVAAKAVAARPDDSDFA